VRPNNTGKQAALLELDSKMGFPVFYKQVVPPGLLAGYIFFE
jgi:hypothetical protein